MATPITAPMVGKILKVEKNVGDHVEEDDVVIVMEAMKMEIPVVAPTSGTLKALKVATGTSRRGRSSSGRDRLASRTDHVLVEYFGDFAMDIWTFGLTVALLGMGGTMLVLWLLSLLILLLKKIFPYQAAAAETKKG